MQDAVAGVGLVDRGAAAEGARDGDDELPGVAFVDGLGGPVDGDAAGNRPGAQTGLRGTDQVGERAEEALVVLGVAGRFGGEPGAGDVDERAVPEPAELEPLERLAPDREPDRLLAVEREVVSAREVVGGAGGMTASGTSRRPAISAARPIEPSPPATAIRS